MSRNLKGWGVTVVALCLWADLPAHLEAQTIHGTVTQADSGEPLAGVRVWLLNWEGRELSLAMTEPDGTFRIRPDDPGEYRLRAVRIGYRDHETEILELGEGEELELEISLEPDPVQLPGVTVEVERLPSYEIQRATYTGLYMRRGDNRWATPGGNRVFVRDDLEPQTGWRVWQFIERYAPANIQRQLRSERRFQREVIQAEMYGQRRPSRDGACPLPSFFIRGSDRGGPGFPTEIPVDVLMYLEIPLREIEGIEFYRQSHHAPMELRPAADYRTRACGVIAIWPRQAGELR
jgi:hypothetical protein